MKINLILSQIITNKQLLYDQCSCILEINSYLEREIQLQRVEMDLEIRCQIENAIVSLKKETVTLSFRKVAKRLGVDVYRILENEEYRGMVECAIKTMEIEKIENIKSTNKKLKRQN